MDDLNKLLGLPRSLTLDGDTFTFAPPDKEIQAKYVQFLKDRDRAETRESIRQLKSDIGKFREAARESDPNKVLSGARMDEIEKLNQQAWDAEQEIRQLQADLHERLSCGFYSFHGAACRKSLGQPETMVYYFWLLLQPNHPGIDLAKVELLAYFHGDEIATLARDMSDLGKLKAQTTTAPANP